MIKLLETLASSYIDKIEKLIAKIDWNKLGKNHQATKRAAQRIIYDIKDIPNYEGENTVEYLIKLKDQAKAAIYVLNNLLEN